EATTVDEETLGLLSRSTAKDVILSKASPLGVPFNYLKGTSSEKEKMDRIKRNKPGSPCTEKYLVSNTEFTKEPICTASIKYQKLKLQQLESSNLPEAEVKKQKADLLAKECLCVGLSNSAPVKYEEPFLKKLTAVTICPGPNIANFSKVASLKEMTDHIYGRTSLPLDPSRQHMFLKELQLYLDYLREEIKDCTEPCARDKKNWKVYCDNLIAGIEHYRELLNRDLIQNSIQFENGLILAEEEIAGIKQWLEKL